MNTNQRRNRRYTRTRTILIDINAQEGIINPIESNPESLNNNINHPEKDSIQNIEPSKEYSIILKEPQYFKSYSNNINGLTPQISSGNISAPPNSKDSSDSSINSELIETYPVENPNYFYEAPDKYSSRFSKLPLNLDGRNERSFTSSQSSPNKISASIGDFNPQMIEFYNPIAFLSSPNSKIKNLQKNYENNTQSSVSNGFETSSFCGFKEYSNSFNKPMIDNLQLKSNNFLQNFNKSDKKDNNSLNCYNMPAESPNKILDVTLTPEMRTFEFKQLCDAFRVAEKRSGSESVITLFKKFKIDDGIYKQDTESLINRQNIEDELALCPSIEKNPFIQMYGNNKHKIGTNALDRDSNVILKKENWNSDCHSGK